MNPSFSCQAGEMIDIFFYCGGIGRIPRTGLGCFANFLGENGFSSWKKAN
jgi:hypothetical protein